MFFLLPVSSTDGRVLVLSPHYPETTLLPLSQLSLLPHPCLVLSPSWYSPHLPRAFELSASTPVPCGGQVGHKAMAMPPLATGLAALKFTTACMGSVGLPGPPTQCLDPEMVAVVGQALRLCACVWAIGRPVLASRPQGF